MSCHWGFPMKAAFFQQRPGAFISGVALGIGPVQSIFKALGQHRLQGFRCVASALVVFIDDIAHLPGLKIPGAVVDVADDLAAFLQLHGEKVAASQPAAKVLSAVFIGDIRVGFKLILPALGEKFIQVVIVPLFKGPQDQTGCFNFRQIIASFFFFKSAKKRREYRRFLIGYVAAAAAFRGRMGARVEMACL